MADPVAVVSALVSALSLLLDEVHRRRDDDAARPGQLRGALVDLDIVVTEWAVSAIHTNAAATDWAAALPDSAGRAHEFLGPLEIGQTGAFKDVRQMFSRPLTGPGRGSW